MAADRAVTVVIPTRDRHRLLPCTLATVLAQRDVDVSVVVVDDGSIDPVRIDDPRVVVVRHEVTRGVSAARNDGIRRVTTPWVAFTDDDDLWAPDKVARQLDALEKVPGARWSCVATAYVDDDLRLLSRGMPPPSGDVANDLLARNSIPGGGSGVLVDTELVRSLGGFDEEMGLCADYELWIRLALAAPMAAVRGPLLAYRVHARGMSRQLDELEDELAAIERKHGAERRARGIRQNGLIHLWAGDRLQRSGRRLASARAYLRAAGSGIPIWLAGARAGEGLLWPNGHRSRDRRRAAAAPQGWVDELEGWLGPLR